MPKKKKSIKKLVWYYRHFCLKKQNKIKTEDRPPGTEY